MVWWGILGSWLVLMACGGSRAMYAAAPQLERQDGHYLVSERAAAAPAAAGGDADVSDWGAPESADEQQSPEPATRDKQVLLIYNAQLVLAVFEVRQVLDRVEVLARGLGGYLVRRSDDGIVVRVPAAKFEQGLAEAAALGDEMSRQVTAEDVSDQYRDLKIRLENAIAMRGRIEALLAQARDVKEALLVEEQLARVTTTIEQLKGKLKMLDELIAFSTITVQLRPSATAEQLKQRVSLPFPWLRELGLSHLLDLGGR